MTYIYFLVSLFFFFKQKTAYEMRISDWSSDVCSSDLGPRPGARGGGHCRARRLERAGRRPRYRRHRHPQRFRDRLRQFRRRGEPDRKSVVEGKSVSVSVELGGRRILKKNNRYRDSAPVKTLK